MDDQDTTPSTENFPPPMQDDLVDEPELQGLGGGESDDEDMEQVDAGRFDFEETTDTGSSLQLPNVIITPGTPGNFEEMPKKTR